MKILYYDCVAGISGDMTIGALLNLGARLEYVVDGLESLPLSGYTLRTAKESRKGIEGTRFEVILDNTSQPPRNFTEIRDMIMRSNLSEQVKRTSSEIFHIIAQAESKIHGTTLDKVHFHEVGAIDSIIDIVGFALCIENLGITTIFSSPVELGRGFVTCAHGTLPIPAPATIEILKDIPVSIGGVAHEATTPTGAAILATSVSRFTEHIEFIPQKVGYGIGTRDTDIPNVLRVIMGEQSQKETRGYQRGDAFVVECTVDDMNPELYEHVVDKLLNEGAFDVFMTPVIMKKSRPGTVLTVVCLPEIKESIRDIVMFETTTFGIREYRVDRWMFERTMTSVSTKYGPVRVKNALLNGETIKSKPEYDDCKELADKNEIPILEIYRSIRDTE